MGKPKQDVVEDVIQRLDPYYPSKSWRVNRELSQLLIYLEAPGVVTKTLALLNSAQTQEEQIHYLFRLRTLKRGWTLAERRQYLEWFDRDWKQGVHAPEVLQWFTDAGREYDNGASFPKFMIRFRQDAIASLSDSERASLASWINRPALPLIKPGPARSFVRDWKMADLSPLLDRVSSGRDYDKGKEAFSAAQCIACHRFGNEGGSTGPDLTAVTSRFTRHDIAESIVDPSKVVSEQYQNVTVFRKDGDDVTGRLVEENDQKLVIVPNALLPDRLEIKKSEVKSVAPSKVSPMPDGLLNTLKQDEVLDLLAYIESGGKRDHAAFGKPQSQ
jgi:putative heme-binding domain-containing protein